MDNKIIVAGIGPGSEDYILPVALRTIKQAKVLVGSKRALAAFAPVNAKVRIIDKDIPALLAFIDRALSENDVVVMVSGDPGFYSLLGALKTKFSAEQIRVIPGISSLQMAFARVACPWHDALLLSLHGREADVEQFRYLSGRKLGLLTDPVHNPCYIAKLLLECGWPPATETWLCSDLSYEQERVDVFTLEQVANLSGYNHCVMVVMS
jgi:cobalt-precorrin-7 (C5)-methyltransferase